MAATLGIAGIAAAAPTAADPAPSASAPAAAQEVGASPESVEPVRRPLALQASLAALRSRLQTTTASTQAGSRSNVMLNRGLDIQVVELPREGAPIGPPPKRAHHAVSIGMEGPKQMLRGLGLDATECAARFRMPSKLSRKGDGSAQIDITAQLGMGCKF
ncbi:hypothetical protein [Mitsuaria sp. 7]|uniref:hypothetical protein n=1 Tax=Mitsuaria sp. 7 TaxID=1658665 RepID=UPI0007DE1DE9|nr:hypothetical protein [Mitsuaria sp. 7]ANH69092.1 hypothetical protein ABE85_18705 [Mitsuaria sp. 7]